MMNSDFYSLFEGNLNLTSQSSGDASVLADALGFGKEPVLSAEVNCVGTEYEWLLHLADAHTAMFALNNVIYTLKRDEEGQ